ncbi:MAG: hypothetical protein ABMB14_20380 [Myxococcota bacterium]
MRVAGWVLVVAGCGGGGDDDGGGPSFPRGCDASQRDGDCILYSGADWTDEDVAGYCTDGTLVPECPPGGAVGTCTMPGGDPGDPFETVSTFYTPFWNAGQASSQCQGQGGTWSGAR